MLAKLTNRFRDILSDWRRRDIGTPISVIPVLIATLGVTGSLLGLRYFGKLQQLELGAYDQMVRSRPAEKVDRRLLVVAVTEEDIQQLRQWPLSDATITKALTNLEKYQPRAIGLDIYRDMPVEPGHQQFKAKLAKSDRFIAICKSNDLNHSGIAPPSTVPLKRIGFSDFPIDPDGVIRRALLFISPSKGKCKTSASFSFRLASQYLAYEGIESYKVDPYGYMGLRKIAAPNSKTPNSPLAVFPRLDSNAGGYQGIDSQGYQILLSYKSGFNVAQQVTLSQVLKGEISEDLVRDRIILIGVTAASIDDAFYTPFSPTNPEQAKMPGVVVHAQIVSQILSAALDGRPLVWYWPEWGEALWIWAWGLAGGLIGWKFRHPMLLGFSGAGAIATLAASSYGILIYSGWVPVVSPALAMLSAGGGMVVYVAYKMYQQHLEIAREAHEQEATIALLTTMLKYNPPSQTTTSPLSETTTSAISQTATTPLSETTTSAISQTATTPLSQSTTTPVSLPPQNFSRSAAPLLPTPIASVLGGRYQITKVLAQGGFGKTYLAKDIQRPGEPICVVKHLMPARRDGKFLQVARRLFQTEAKILEVLGQHHQIPQLLAYLAEKEEFYLVEEYIEGDPLSDELPVDKRLSEAIVVDLLQGILDILAFIHQHQVIHRDIKPSNIIRRKQDHKLVLIDFGAVKQIQPPSGPETENPTIAIGTRGYAPAEQLAGHPRPASDIYAVGMIAIQALTGIQPQNIPQDEDTGTVVWRPLANVSYEFAEIVDRMVCYHFSDRYKSASAVLKDLNRLDRTSLSNFVPKQDLEVNFEDEQETSILNVPILQDKERE